MRIGNTISLAWCLTTRILISLLNKFTGINNGTTLFLATENVVVPEGEVCFQSVFKLDKTSCSLVFSKR